MVVAAEEDVRIQFCKQFYEVDVQTDGQRDKSKRCRHSGEDNRGHPRPGSLYYRFLHFNTLLNEEVSEFYQQNAVPYDNTRQRHNTHTRHDDGYLHLE